MHTFLIQKSSLISWVAVSRSELGPRQKNLTIDMPISTVILNASMTLTSGISAVSKANMFACRWWCSAFWQLRAFLMPRVRRSWPASSNLSLSSSWSFLGWSAEFSTPVRWFCFSIYVKSGIPPLSSLSYHTRKIPGVRLASQKQKAVLQWLSKQQFTSYLVREMLFLA